jgi:cytidylate kinase
MAVITIAREMGSEGDQLGMEVAKALGYEVLNKEIIKKVAEMTGASAQEVEHYDERADNWLARFLTQVFAAHPEMAAYYSTFAYVEPNYIYGVAEPYVFYQAPPGQAKPLDPKKVVEHVEKIIREVADKGNVVIIGRASQCILSGRADAIHLRTVGPLEWRVANVLRDNADITREQAEETIRQNDKWRERYLSVNYGADWRDPLLYHAVLSMQKCERGKLIEFVKCSV